MKKAIIVGLGFIATNLARYLVSLGYEVHVTYRSIKGTRSLMAKDLMELGVKLRRVDPNDYGELRKTMEEVGPDYVFNTVGRISGSWRDLWSAHVEVPRNIARAILDVDRRIKLVHISASAASGPIGNFIREEPVHCDYAYVRPRSNYERSKCDGERTLRELGSEGLRYVIVRPTLVYGYYNDHEEFLMLYRVIRRGLIPIVRVRVSMIYVGYLVRLLERLAVSDEFNNSFLYATECQQYDLGDLTRTMAMHMGVRGLSIPIPTVLAGLALPSGARALLRYVNVQYDCSNTVKVLGNLEPGLDRGIEEIIDWIKRAYGF
ncbi:NAD-dependent epimerase/dehydratase family protein [Vulcanisaeta thermophila]|uniref:NAD-dependent epimerase/dehydratase family protein n=1 Tax=Vulcanisaeta thermophila TaxID=867917 RepID=UPI000852F74F|nr:NAD-dependent epimerase/dehydratase family protein [Vulcanisaeta thermophila]